MVPCRIWIKLSFIVSFALGTIKHNLPLVNPHHKRPGLIQIHVMPFWLLVIAERWAMQDNIRMFLEWRQAVMDEPAEQTSGSWTILTRNIDEAEYSIHGWYSCLLFSRDTICYTSYANVIIFSRQRDELCKLITLVEYPNTTRTDLSALKSPSFMDLTAKLLFFKSPCLCQRQRRALIKCTILITASEEIISL